jgi:hypothetical protein
VLIVRRELLTNTVPDVVGGGTVAYVNSHEHRYLEDPVHREEGGTPAIVESIRAGMVFQLKEAVGSKTIQRHESDLLRRALHVWTQIPSMQILGHPGAERLSIVSFVIRRPGGRYLHHNFVVAVLNDLFGIQSRGGCSCAGPYGHRLLDIDEAHSHEYEQEIIGGCEGIKPGWVRVNLNYFISEAVFDYIVTAVAWTAMHGHRLLAEYRFDPSTGLWQHRSGVTQTLIRLTDLTYDEQGRLDTSHIDKRKTADESVLTTYLEEANRILECLQDPEDHSEADIVAALADRVGPNFEHLRWFELTPLSLR